MVRALSSFASPGQRSRVGHSDSGASRPKDTSLAAAGPLTLLIQHCARSLTHYDEADVKRRAGVCNMLFSSPHLEVLAPPITHCGRFI